MTRARGVRPLFIVLGLLAPAACAAENGDMAPPLATTSGTVSIHTAMNPAASFDRYRTFSFGPAEGPPLGYKASARSAEVQRRLPALIAAALEERGYLPASGKGDKGDVVILFGSGRRDISVHDESDISAEWLPSDENADLVEGSLVIDAFDGAKGSRVWHGASRANVNPDKLDEQRLRLSVEDLISAFPPAKTSARGGP